MVIGWWRAAGGRTYDGDGRPASAIDHCVDELHAIHLRGGLGVKKASEQTKTARLPSPTSGICMSVRMRSTLLVQPANTVRASLPLVAEVTVAA